MCTVQPVVAQPVADQTDSTLFRPDFTLPLSGSEWQGDLTSFYTTSDGMTGTLRQDAPSDQGIATLASHQPYDPVYLEWTIFQDFTPSNSNRALIFLNANQPQLNNNVQGLAIRTGENGTPKHFRLFRFDDSSSPEELLISDLEIQGSSWYRIRVVYTPDNMIHLYVADGRYATPLLQSGKASADDIGFEAQGYFGIRTHFTATRSDLFSFGGVVLADALPEPGVARVSVKDANDTIAGTNSSSTTTIEVTFNVPPDSPELTPGLFQLDNGLVPDEITCSHIQQCRLTFYEPVSPGRYHLTVSSYKTIYDQTSEPETSTLLIADVADPGDLVINEFMYRPPDGLPSYVELFNHSDKLLNLRDWRLQRRAIASETDRYITETDHFLEPGDYVVLTDEPAPLEEQMQARHILEMTDFPRFNFTSPDKIRIYASDGTRIDSLQYHPSDWGGDEVALERKSPEAPGWLAINWAESGSPSGGTPGYQNTVDPPETPPSVDALDHTHADTLRLVFDRLPDPRSLVTPGHIRLIPSGAGQPIPWKQIAPMGSTIILQPSSPLEHDHEYELHISGVRDIFGTAMPDTMFSFHFYVTEWADPGDIVINEILYRPDPDKNHRFVELFNRSKRVIDLRGWQIERSLGGPVAFAPMDDPAPHYLAPGEKAVISEPELMTPGTSHRHYRHESFPSLSRLGDVVMLRSPDGEVIDSLPYQPEWGGNRDGVSLERRDPLGATLDPANWEEHPGHHTAGIRNYNYTDQPEAPKANYAALLGSGYIRVHFNRFVRPESLSHVTVGEQALHLVGPDGEPTESASTFHFASRDSVRRTYKEVTIHDIRDYAGRAGSPHSIPLAFIPQKGDAIINEIMYQPIAERYSSKPDQSEYIELHNRSGLALQLQGVHLHDKPDKHGDVGVLVPEKLGKAAFLPDDYIVIHADTSRRFESTRIYRAFSLDPESRDRFFRVDRLTLGLSTQGDEVYLADAAGRILDWVSYDPSWHNPSLADTRGISLERILPDGQSGDRDNWTSSSVVEGGTPGAANSATAVQIPEHSTTGIALAPNPFSPNNDGDRDQLTINYTLDGPDYMMRVRIFDRSGRLVRTLADRQHAGRSGTLIWDGRTDQGVMNRIGLYIIHFEAFDGNTGNSNVFREIAVLAEPF